MASPGDSRQTSREVPAADTTDPGADAEPPQWLTLETSIEDVAAWSAIPDVEDLAGAAARALATHEQFAKDPPSIACLALATNAEVHALNRQHRGFDKPTNVLSFPVPADTFADPERSIVLLGDIIIAAETVLVEAREQSIAPAHHLQHLIVHGLLHLLGFDHETDDEAVEMEALETEILATLGVADPHAAPLS